MSYNLFGQLKANFNLDQIEGCNFLAPRIENTSTASTTTQIVEYLWDLGGTIIRTSNPQAPNRTFTKAGSSTICLTVTDNTGATNQTCKTIYVYNIPEVDFNPDITTGCAPLTVNFANSSFSQNGRITSLVWDVGGSGNIITTTDPTLKPSSSYASKRLQSVSLKITDEKGCTNTITKKDIIKIEAPDEVIPTLRFVQSCALPWTVQVANANLGNGVTYEWDFGNGQKRTGAGPFNIDYTSEGTYAITVNAQIGGCSKNFEFKDLVKINRAKDLDITIDTICEGVDATISSDLASSADSVVWIINGANAQRTKTFKYTFNKTGCNEFKVIRFRAGCKDTLTQKCIFVKPKEAISYKVDNQKTCLLPAKIAFNGTGAGTWRWTIDDKTFNLKDTSITYTTFGDRKLNLTYTHLNGCQTKDSFNIQIQKFEAELPFLGPEGCSPVSFSLSDSIQSELPIVSTKWTIYTPTILTFNERSPRFTIADTGRYDVRLEVQNSIGCIDTIFRPNYLGVGIKPVIEFAVDPANDCKRTPRQFTDLSSKYTNQWRWDFGDKSPLDLTKNPIHIYPDTGFYTVTLTAGQNGCFSSLTKKDFVYVKAPIAGLERIYRCDDPTLVSYKQSVKYGDTIYWVIDYLGVKPTDTLKTKDIDAIRFPGFGKYAVTIFTENYSTGCLDMATDSLIITNPKVNYIPDTLKGCVPLRVNYELQLQDIDSSYFTYNSTALNQTYIDFTTPGKYINPIIMGQDINKCRDTFQLADTIYASDINFKPVIPKAVCIPDSLMLSDSSTSVFGAIAKVRWTLDDKDTITNDAAQYYINKATSKVSLYVEDTWGCKSSGSYSVPGITLSPGIKRDSLGCTTSDILLIATGSNEFTERIDWDFGDGITELNQPFTKHRYSKEGIYLVNLNMVDMRGCSKEIVDTVKIINPIASFEGTDLFATCPPLVSNFNNKSSNASKFTWLFGDGTSSDLTNPSHLYNSVNKFSVTIIAQSSDVCSDTFTLQDYVEIQGPKASVISVPLSNCTPLKVRLTTSSDDNYFYIWDDDQGNVESSTTKSINDAREFVYNKPGVYSPRVIVKNDANCSIAYEADKVEVNEIKADFDLTNDPLCSLIANPKFFNKTKSTGSNTSYIWSLSGKDFSSIRFDSLPNFLINQYGSFDVTLIASAKNCIDTLLKPGAIYVSTPPKANFDLPPLFCQSQVNNIINKSDTALQGAISYMWQDQTGKVIGRNRDLDYIPTLSGLNNIKLILTNQALCIDSITKNILISSDLKATLPNDTLICIGEPITITNSVIGSNIKTFDLKDNNGSILCTNCPTIGLIPSSNSSYTLTAINNDGCTYIDTMLVSLAPVRAPDFSVSYPQEICKDSSAKYILSNLETEWSATWTNSNRDTICKGNCREITYNPTLVNQLNVTVKNELYKCSTTKTLDTKIERSIPNFLVDNRTVCEGDSATLSVGNVKNYTWRVPGYTVCDTCNTITFKPKGTTLVYVNAFSPLGCPYKDTANVYTYDRRLIFAGPDTIVCKGASVALRGLGFGIPLWSPGSNLTDANSFTPKYQADSSATLYFSTTNDQCISNDSLKVTVIDRLLSQVTNDTICPYEFASIHLTTNAPASYSWKSTSAILDNKRNKNTIEIKAKNSTTIIWKISMPTCPDVFDTSTVFVHPLVDYYFITKSYTISLNNAKQIQAIYDKEKAKSYDFTWSNTKFLDCDKCPLPFISGIDKNMSFPLKIVDKKTGCVLNDSVVARLKYECTPDGFALPNVMSQNSISNNNFKFFAYKIEQFRAINIYDRWGNNVFNSTDPNILWDGTLQGKPAAQGVYVVRIDAVCPETSEEYSIIRDVTVIP